MRRQRLLQQHGIDLFVGQLDACALAQAAGVGIAPVGVDTGGDRLDAEGSRAAARGFEQKSARDQRLADPRVSAGDEELHAGLRKAA